VLEGPTQVGAWRGSELRRYSRHEDRP
jgi:hypothetical protein